MSAAPELDRSWDVGELQMTPDGYTATRPRSEERPEARKIILGHYMEDAAQPRHTVQKIFTEELNKVVDVLRDEHRHDIDQLRTEFSQLRADSTRMKKSIISLQDRLLHLTERNVFFDDVAEGYEVIARTLQGFNDIIFDTERQSSTGDVVLTVVEKEVLKSHGVEYLSRLLNPLEDLPSEADILRLKALSILSPEQQQLCRALVDAQESDSKRNILHHPRPDRDTAMDRLAEFLDEEVRHAFEKYLKTDLQRLPSRREQHQAFGAADLYLFAEAGQYTNVATKKADLEDLKAEKVEMTMYLEALEQEGT